MQGVAVAQLCKTVDNVTVFGTASSAKHDVIQNIVDNVYDHSIDYVQEIRKCAYSLGYIGYRIIYIFISP